MILGHQTILSLQDNAGDVVVELFKDFVSELFKTGIQIFRNESNSLKTDFYFNQFPFPINC